MKGINIKFPVSDDTTTNAFLKLNNVTKEAFSSNLLLLLLTEKGERYYMPNFGTNLLKYVFEPSDNITVDEIMDELNETVSEYIPNLKIDDVNFNWVKGNGSTIEMDGTARLNLKIGFVYSEDAFSERGEIELDF